MDGDEYPGFAAGGRPVGARLPANAVGQIASMAAGDTHSRASSLPQWTAMNVRDSQPTEDCRGALARERGGSALIHADWRYAFASKLTPTMDRDECPGFAAYGRPVGARLPANAVGQIASMATGKTPSRASARLQMDLSKCTPDLRQHKDLNAPNAWYLPKPRHKKTRRGGFLSNRRLNGTSCLQPS